MNPDSPLTRNYKTKERYITAKIQAWINDNHKDLNIILDKTIDSACSKRRPDMFIDLLTHVVIIEVDENQHKQTSCENKRMMQLYQDVAHRPCVFIRFNPDSYRDVDNKYIKGCFKYTKAGVCVIDSDKRLITRLEPVYEALNKYLIEPQDKSVHVEQYWYDENE